MRGRIRSIVLIGNRDLKTSISSTCLDSLPQPCVYAAVNDACPRIPLFQGPFLPWNDVRMQATTSMQNAPVTSIVKFACQQLTTISGGRSIINFALFTISGYPLSIGLRCFSTEVSQIQPHGEGSRSCIVMSTPGQR